MFLYPVLPNKERAKHAIVVFYIVFFGSLANLAFRIWQFITFQKWSSDPSTIDMDLAYQMDDLEIFVVVGSLLLIILAAIFFILWFRRAYYNLHAVAPGQASFGEGWAAGAWFVPILNLFRPYQIMKEIWEGSQRAMPHRFPSIASSAIVGNWWALWIISRFAINIASSIPGDNPDIWDLKKGAIGLIIAQVITIVAVFMAIHMIRKMSEIEDQLWDEAQNPSDSIFADNQIEPQAI